MKKDLLNVNMILIIQAMMILKMFLTDQFKLNQGKEALICTIKYKENCGIKINYLNLL